MDKEKMKWVEMLTDMLNQFRAKNPQDKRSDKELLESLMDHFFLKGRVGKDMNGKYIVPKIKED